MLKTGPVAGCTAKPPRGSEKTSTPDPWAHSVRVSWGGGGGGPDSVVFIKHSQDAGDRHVNKLKAIQLHTLKGWTL